MSKIGRNNPCPCGSGRKYKRCHGLDNCGGPTEPPGLQTARMDARRVQRERQQGLGKPIISAEWQGHRFVAVGGRVVASPRWKTLHDFLMDYVRNALGADWGTAEIARPADERHPVVTWYQTICRQQREATAPGGPVRTPVTGAATAFLQLSYDLYALEHNVELRNVLLTRLKDRNNFDGARYEMQVAAMLIRAGFTLEFEDETDRSSRHCEFTATYPRTGRSFSVEVKRRQGRRGRIGGLFNDAISKHAKHPRVIFIDLNLRDDGEPSLRVEPEFFKSAERRLRAFEGGLLNGKPYPSARVFLTNTPWDLYPDDPSPRSLTIALGFQLPDFAPPGPRTLRQLIDGREAHVEMHALFDSIQDHSQIPATFDGEIAESAFGDASKRLLIGGRYAARDVKGQLRPATLASAVVDEQTRQAVCAFNFDGGGSVINSVPLSDGEIGAWKNHPDTFFGVLTQRKTTAETPLEVYDFFHASVRHASKERLLELMKGWSNLAKPATLTRDELASLYAEGLAESALRNRL
jgi:hypothetical protein